MGTSNARTKPLSNAYASRTLRPPRALRPVHRRRQQHGDDEPDLDDEDDEDDELKEIPLRDALPAGWQVNEEPPASLDRQMVNSMVAFRWTVIGWCVAKVHKYYPRPKGVNALNYQLQYTVGSQIVEHRLRTSDYSSSDDARAGAWCLLRRTDPGSLSPQPASAPAPAAAGMYEYMYAA